MSDLKTNYPFRPTLNEIISKIGEPDEVKITEFDFDRCFAALRKIAELDN